MSDDMSPSASPGNPGAGVRALNRVPIYIAGAVLALFILMVVWVAVQKANEQRVRTLTQEAPRDSSVYADEIVGDRTGIIPPLEVPEEVLIAPPPPDANLDNLPPPPALAAPDPLPAPAPADPEIERIRLVKIQMLENAAKAKTAVQTVGLRDVGSAGSGGGGIPKTKEEMLARLAEARRTADDPTAAYQARLAQIRAMQGASGESGGGGGEGGSGSSSASALTAARNSNSNKSFDQFAQAGGNDRWRLDSKPEAPRTAYELRAGFIVPATMISGINSDLAGQITAQVSQNVYDTPTGKYLLIPQGTRLVGTYNADVLYGQDRVLIAWQRLVFPDGKAMDIGTMPGADSAGYAGFKDRVNHHYMRVFGTALLTSVITAAASHGIRGEEEGFAYRRRTMQDEMAEALAEQMGQVMAQMIAKNMNIAPTIEIRPGYRFNVMVTKDMTFNTPYQSFDY